MKHKIYATRFYIAFLIFVLILSVPYISISLYFLVSAIISKDIVTGIATGIIALMFTVFTVCCVFVMNKEACKVWYDEETQKIGREGLIKGHKYSTNVENITDIILINIYRAGLYFEIMEEATENSLSKKYPIRIQFNENNKKFIKRFWDKPITHIVDMNGKMRDITDYEKRLYGL